ncbi:MAG TPA: histidine phosphatase family protein [Acidobacteriota bacterium]|nr:histidine phosphatase family protein [Acidobacteriota bacterium]
MLNRPQPRASTVWIVRHGNRKDFEDPEWHRTAVRPYDPPLSEEGRRQARETGRRLVRENITHIWSSPFLRCVETAQLIADEMNGSFKLEEGLSEWLNPEWFSYRPDTRDPEWLQRRYSRLDTGYESAVRATFPETRSQMLERVGRAVDRLVNLEHGNILLVGHGASVQGSVARLLEVDLREKGDLLLSIPCCSLVRLNREKASWSLELKADTAHLSQVNSGQRFI